ncbi:MAG: DUF3857 domain-containing transglutaminase family protein [Thermoanaerobaculia bacterium]|nr:DUF3857 domain-containing transglutaminase family protein [Thermoanaerobaculia bacterium]
MAALMPAHRADAAIVESEHRTVTIRADGSVREDHRRVVHLESESDVEEWGTFPIYLDLNRTLKDFEGKVTGADGKVRKIRRKHRDEMQLAGSSELHASRSYYLVEPEGLRPGAKLDLAWSLEIEPYFPANAIFLERDDPVEDFQLTIRLEPGVEGWRWRVDGPDGEGFGRESLSFDESAAGPSGGLRVTGSISEAQDDLDSAAGPTAPVLRYAWGGDSWRHVGSWYRGLLEGVPRDDGALSSLTTELTAGAQNDRERLERLVRYVQDRVRYVAVQIGIGGYVPTPPGETIDRQWGDCKDKGVLLVELLRQLDIEAFPALVRLDASKSFDADFPSADQFNHLIVAIPEEEIAVTAEDPVSGGYLFVDATQSRGSARYLNSWAGGQQALVVTPGGGSLVTTPTNPESQNKRLAGIWTVDDTGSAEARLVLEYAGDVAASLLAFQSSTDPAQLEPRVQSIWRSVVPQAELSEVKWGGHADELPVFRLEAEARIDSWISGRGDSYAAELPKLGQTPKLRDLGEVPDELPVDAKAGRADVHFEIHLPPGVCAPKQKDDAVQNTVGSFSHEVSSTGDPASGVKVTVKRTTIVQRPYVAPEARQDLLDLATAEYRAGRRKLRFRCN